MPGRPLISVALPVHNGERFLSAALESIRTQTFGDFEIIVIDDGSTDGTSDIVREYALLDPRLRAQRQEHRGLVASLNLAMSLARGTYLARMDADDIASPRRFAEQVQFLETRPEIGVVGGGIVVVDERDRPLFPVHYPLTDRLIRRALASGSAFAHPVVMMRMDALVASGGYRAPFLHAEDFDLWLRLSERWGLANLPGSLLRHRFHKGGVSFRNLQQQVISMVGAELSASMRRAKRADTLADDGLLTVDALLGARPQRDHVLSRVLELSASRAGFLVLVGEADEGLRLLEWGRTIAGRARLERRARARAHLTRAFAWYRKASPLRTVAHAAAAVLVDPLTVLETAAGRGRLLMRGPGRGTGSPGE